MKENEIRSVLTDIVDDIQDDPVDKSTISDQTRLREDLGIDSLQTAEMLVEIEMRLGVAIESEEVLNLKTVGDVVNLIKQKGPSLRSEEEQQ